MLKRNNSRYAFITIGFLLAIFFLTGCATIYRKPVFRGEVPQIKKGEKINRDKILSYLENQPELETFKAKGKISIRTNKWSGSGRIFVAGQYPDKLHFEVFDFFANPKWIINATQKGVEALSIASRELYVSNGTRDLMNGLFAIPVDLEEVFFFFTGQKPPLQWPDARLSMTDNHGHILLEGPSKSMDRWLLYINPSNLILEKAVIWHSRDHTRLRIGFDNYSSLGNYVIPYTRVLSVKNAQMKIKYKEFVANQPIDGHIFKLKKPRNTRIIRVGLH